MSLNSDSEGPDQIILICPKTFSPTLKWAYLNTRGILVGIMVTSLSNAMDFCSGNNTFRYQSITLLTWTKSFQYIFGQCGISNLDGIVRRHLWTNSENFLVSTAFSGEDLNCLYWNSKYLKETIL